MPETRVPPNLGLPLSNVKLRLSAFAPLIAKVDRYLSGWKATLLSYAGRVTLINAVLDGRLTYAMGAMALPPGVLDALDARRRAFLWTGTDKATGARCFVAWEKATTRKEDGGLGIRRLDTQNACLLLKLIHRLHHPQDSSWATWARQHINLATLEGAMVGEHWTTLRALLPAYRSITQSEIGVGSGTSFWYDHWTDLDSTLAETFPAVKSHFIGGDASVEQVLTRGVENMLQPRLTAAATEELRKLQQVVSTTPRSGKDDERTCLFEQQQEHRSYLQDIQGLSARWCNGTFLPFCLEELRTTSGPVLRLAPHPE